MLSGKTHPSFEMISAIIVNYPFVNSKWLLTGAGEWNQTDEVLPDNTGFLNSVIKMKDEQLQSLRQEVELYRSKSSVNDSSIEAEVDGEKPLTYSLTCTSDMA